jgi:hypothetical protein
MTIEFAIGFGVVAFIVFCIMAAIILHELKLIRQHCEMAHDKWSRTENRCQKIEAAADWWVHHNGCMYDFTSFPLAVTPIKSGNADTLSSVWKEIKANRETIAYHLYQAHLRALQDFEQQKQEQTKNKRKKK